LFFLYRLEKKEERKKKTKMHAATHHGQQSASFVSLGENGGKRHRLRARSCRLRSGERRSKKDRIRNNASSSSNNNNNSDAQDSIGNEEEEKYKTETKARANRLRAKVIKQYLGAMGEKTNDCFDKEDLVERLTRAWMAKSRDSVRVPLRRVAGVPGNPRAGYCLVTLNVKTEDEDGERFCDFLIDSGATVALVSPELRKMMGKFAEDGAALKGLGAMGETIRQKVVIKNPSLGAVEIPELDAVVTDLRATGLPPVVGGLLGLDFLQRFEVEFDFDKETITFHPRGSAITGVCDVSDLIKVRLKTHPTGLQLAPISLNNCEPIDAIIDMGSLFSVINWKASERAGVTKDSPDLDSSGVISNDVTGAQMGLAIGKFDLKVLGEKSSELSYDLESTYKGAACVGDLPAFETLGAKNEPFATIGMDVIGRKRLVLDMYNHRIYLSPGE
jgi:predicted aspartyl protease